MSKLGPISHFLSPVCDSLVLQGLMCEWGAGVLNTGHWKFNMASHGKELSEDMKKRFVALHTVGVGYKKIAKRAELQHGVRTPNFSSQTHFKHFSIPH